MCGVYLSYGEITGEGQGRSTLGRPLRAEKGGRNTVKRGTLPQRVVKVHNAMSVGLSSAMIDNVIKPIHRSVQSKVAAW